MSLLPFERLLFTSQWYRPRQTAAETHAGDKRTAHYPRSADVLDGGGHTLTRSDETSGLRARVRRLGTTTLRCRGAALGSFARDWNEGDRDAETKDLKRVVRAH